MLAAVARAAAGELHLQQFRLLLFEEAFNLGDRAVGSRNCAKGGQANNAGGTSPTR